ncbi:MAG: tetratricopeptide repeat protein [Bacteroidia bacterium]|nr:tetratricopeptide repeat protein [Bacteroidia bacterium]
MIRTRIFFAIFLLLLSAICMAEQNPIDSLKNVISKAPEDSTKVDLLNELSKTYRSTDPAEAIRVGEEAKTLAQKINFKSGKALAFKNIGIGNYQQGDYVKAINNWETAMVLWDSLGDKAGVSNMLNNQGSVFFNQGDYDRALDLYLKSLKIAEDIKDTNRIVTALYNVGAVYSNKKKTYDKAKQYYLDALPLAEKISDEEERNYNIGTINVNLGEIFFKEYNEIDTLKYESSLDSAIKYFERSLIAYKGTENIPYSLNYIGRVYERRKKFDLAVGKHEEAFEISKGLDAQLDMAISLIGLGRSHRLSGNVKLSTENYLKAREIAIEKHFLNELKEIYEGLTKNYTIEKKFEKVAEFQKLLLATKDSIYNIEADKKLQGTAFTHDLEKKQGEVDLQKEIVSKQKLIRNGFIGGFAIVLLFAVVFLSQRNRISKEKKRSDELLLNILPEETAEELKATGTAKAKSFDMVSVLFTDFKNFTQASEILSPAELVAEINHCYSEFDKIITRHGIEKIKTIGDAYMCAGGLPKHNSTNPEDVVKAGLEMVAFIEKNKQERLAKGQPFFELRCGVHTGPVVAGIVGIKKFAYDIWGDTVNTASRMESSGEIGKVNISGTTYELVKDKFKCVHRGKVKAKNKGEIDMYFVEGKI